METAMTALIYAIAVGFFLLFLVIIVKIWKDKIPLDGLLAEAIAATVPAAPAGAESAVSAVATGLYKASLSRFQLLVFTFVTAGLFLVLSIEAGQMVDIPNGVLGLLGISGGSYVTAKAVK